MKRRGYEVRPGADLQYAELSGADLSQADLRGCDLSYADLRGADLRNADLSHSKLFKTKFSDARLFNTKFVGAELNRCNFSPSDVLRRTRDINMRELDFSNAQLSRVKLERVLFRESIFDGSVFTQCWVGSTGFISSSLKSTTLRDPIVRSSRAGKDLITAQSDLHRAKISQRVVHPAEHNLLTIQLVSCNFSESVISGVSVDIRNCRGVSSVLEDVLFRGWVGVEGGYYPYPKTLTQYDVGFSGTKILFPRNSVERPTVNKFSTHFWKVDLRGVEVLSGDFRRAYLREVDFRGAVLQDTSFLKCEFQEVNFSHLDLRSLNFTTSAFHECVFEDSPGFDLGQAKPRPRRVKRFLTKTYVSWDEQRRGLDHH